jgi:hypothetical protein
VIERTVACPRRFRRIHERVLEKDLDYFRRHPGETAYTRPYVPGELWPVALTDVAAVRVLLLRPGYRARIPIAERAAQGGPS